MGYSFQIIKPDPDKCFIFQVHSNLTLVYKAPPVYLKTSVDFDKLIFKLGIS